MNSKSQVFEVFMQQVLQMLERFKYIDKAIDNLSKRLCKTATNDEEFSELMKLYNSTGSLYTKSLELINNIVCRFPLEVLPDELEVLEHYRNLMETDKLLAREYIKHMRISNAK